MVAEKEAIVVGVSRGGMMVKDVTKFHKCHLGGWGMLECVYVCKVSYRILSFGRGGHSKVRLTWRGCMAQQLGVSGGALHFFFF